MGRKLPRLWSRGRRASPRQRGSCLGRRRSYGGPGLTKPVQPLSPPQRGASSRTCHRPQQPRNPPLQGRRASDPAGVAALAGLVPRPPAERCRSWSYEAGPAADTASAWSVLPYMRPPAATSQPSPTRPSRQRPRNHPPSFPRRRESTGRRGVPSPMCDRPRRPRVPPPTWLSRQRPGAPKGNTNALKSGRYSPRFNAVRTALSQRPGGPGLPRRTPSSAAPHQAHGRRGDAHGPAGGHAACPHREQPPPRLSAEDTPWANRPGKGLRPKSIKGGSSNSLGKGALAGKQLLFYPPASFKRRQKTQSNLTKGD